MKEITQLKIKVDWLQTTVHVFFVNDVVEFRNGKLIKMFPKLPKMDNLDDAYGLSTHHKSYPYNYFITLEKTAHYGVIAHECYHVVKRIFDGCNIDDEEATAYLLDYLVFSIQKKLDK
jgi:hypothetical protein